MHSNHKHHGRGAFPFGPPDFAAMLGGRGFGPGGPGGPGGFGGPGGPGGFGGPRGRGRGPGRGRRGDVRKAILALLAEGPLNGYQVMEAISERTQGLWRPSPGSVYPALNLLEDEGLIETSTVDGKKVFQLTDAGRTHVAEQGEAMDEPWQSVAGPHEGALDVWREVKPLMMAVHQIATSGTETEREQSARVLAQARKDLHRILAGDAAPGDAGERPQDA